jgi:hypothetical protein
MSQKINFRRLQGRYSFVATIASGFYRLSGIALFFIIPGTLWIAHLSLQSVYQFSEARYWIFHPIGKILVILSTTLCLYYSFMGIYNSYLNKRIVANNQVVIISTILILTTLFAGIMGYWLW